MGYAVSDNVWLPIDSALAIPPTPSISDVIDTSGLPTAADDAMEVAVIVTAVAGAPKDSSLAIDCGEMMTDAVGAPNACALAMFPAPNIFAPGISAVTVARPNDSAEAMPALETVARIDGEPIASADAMPVVAIRGMIVGAPIAAAEAMPAADMLGDMLGCPLASALAIAAETIECGATAGATIGAPIASDEAIPIRDTNIDSSLKIIKSILELSTAGSGSPAAYWYKLKPSSLHAITSRQSIRFLGRPE